MYLVREKNERVQKSTEKKIVLRRCKPSDADGICGNNGGDAFDTDAQHFHNLKIYYTKLIHSNCIFSHFILL